MKVEVGKHYITKAGEVTAPLQATGSIETFPFKDLNSNRLYMENGRCASGEKHSIVALYHDPTPTEKPYGIDTVTISLERYDRFVAIEKALKEIYTEAKKHL